MSKSKLNLDYFSQYNLSKKNDLHFMSPIILNQLNAP